MARWELTFWDGKSGFQVTRISYNPEQQLGLFVIWQNARALQARILSDMDQRFELLGVHEVTWTPRRVMDNFQRFYSDLEVRGVYHVFNKGAGPFLAVTLVDPSPSFESRMTSRGQREVNARFLDAKQLYRAWSGGLEVHCGETPWETNRDLTMLLGVDAKSYLDSRTGPWNQTVETLQRDLPGAEGWPSAEELFRVLNQSVVYVLTGDTDGRVGAELLNGNGVNLMAEDYYALHTVLNARIPSQVAPHGGTFRVAIGGREVPVGLRFAGDQYYDARWAKELLATRVLDPRGFYRPNDKHMLATLAYHALMHKPNMSRVDKQHLLHMSARMGVASWTEETLRDSYRTKQLLDEFLSQRGYAYVKPLDTTVYFNADLLEKNYSGVQQQKANMLRRRIADIVRRLKGTMLAWYWHARDRVLLRAPWLRSVKRWIRDPQSG